MSFRIDQINELVKRNMGEIISRELSLKPGIFITITKVDTARDLGYSHIFISIFPEKETGYVIKTLKNELYNIQGILNRKLHLKKLPHIEFRIDMTESKADEIEKIFKKLENESRITDLHL
jgi:ribosome-binding factor A